MNEDAFARRFYADRSELEALGIVLSVEKPQDGQVEQENYSLPPENFHLPAIEFSDDELAALWTALLSARREVRLRRAAATGAPADLLGPHQARSTRRCSARSRSGSPVPPTAMRFRSGWPRSRRRSSGARRSSSSTTRWSATRRGPARSTLTSCSSRAASSMSSVVRTSATRSACSGSPESRARSVTRPRLSTTSSDRPNSTRAPTPTASSGSSATARYRRDLDLRQDRVADRAPFRPLWRASPRRRWAGQHLQHQYANSRQLIAWVLGLGGNAHVVGPPELLPRCGNACTCSPRGTPATPTSCWRRRTANQPSVGEDDAGRGAARRRRPTASVPTRRSGRSASLGW